MIRSIFRRYGKSRDKSSNKGMRTATLYLTALLWLTGSVSIVAQPGATPDQLDDIEPNVISQPRADLDDIEPNVVAYRDYHDPLIRLNRAIFGFNDISYRYALIPAARFYQNSVPEPARTGIGNFFHNLKTPIYMVNHLFQGKPRAAGKDIGRFLINSTLGVAGVFDPALHWFDLERATPRAGDTLAGYGVGYGVYLVLPFVGASNLRDGTGILLDAQLNPIPYLMDSPESIAVRAFDNFQEYAPAISAYLEIRAQSDDPYIFMRNLHLEGMQRDAEYRNENSTAD